MRNQIDRIISAKPMGHDANYWRVLHHMFWLGNINRECLNRIIYNGRCLYIDAFIQFFNSQIVFSIIIFKLTNCFWRFQKMTCTLTNTTSCICRNDFWIFEEWLSKFQRMPHGFPKTTFQLPKTAFTFPKRVLLIGQLTSYNQLANQLAKRANMVS